MVATLVRGVCATLSALAIGAESTPSAFARGPNGGLPHRVEPPSSIHFTPGNPFGVRAGIKLSF